MQPSIVWIRWHGICPEIALSKIDGQGKTAGSANVQIGRKASARNRLGTKPVRLNSVDYCLKCGDSSAEKEWASYVHVTDKKGNRTGQKVPYGGACDERDTTHVQSPPDIQGSLAQVADAIESDPKGHTAQL